MLRGREVSSGQVIPLIGKIDEWIAITILGLELALVCLDLLDDGFGLLRCIVAQRRRSPVLIILLYFVRPTGTTEMDSTIGRSAARSRMLLSRCGPSLIGGQSTSCV